MTLPSNWPWLLASAMVLLATPQLGGLYDVIAFEVAGNGATVSVVTQEAAWKHPWFKWCVCLIIGVFIGHVFTTLPWPRPLGTWVPLVVFVIVPYLAAVAAMVLEFEPLPGVPLRELSRSHPLGVGLPITIGFTVLGILVGACLLHQTSE